MEKEDARDLTVQDGWNSTAPEDDLSIHCPYRLLLLIKSLIPIT